MKEYIWSTYLKNFLYEFNFKQNYINYKKIYEK
jgi:hypothetical protein